MASTRTASSSATRGVMRVGPGAGEMACGEFGEGRMAEPDEILGAIEAFFRGEGAAVTPSGGAPGRDYPLATGVTFAGDLERGYVGGAVAGGAELKQDGYTDWAVGAPGLGAAGIHPGRVYVFLGGAEPDALPDLMIEGDGFFQVTTAVNGVPGIGYTRAGNFTTNRDGTLVLGNSDGSPLEPPIVIPIDAVNISVTRDGQVQVGGHGDDHRARSGPRPAGERHRGRHVERRAHPQQAAHRQPCAVGRIPWSGRRRRS